MSKRLDAHDERNSAFEPDVADMAEHGPGFDDQQGRERSAKDEHRFPRKSAQAEVPREPLAARLGKSGKRA